MCQIQRPVKTSKLRDITVFACLYAFPCLKHLETKYHKAKPMLSSMRTSKKNQPFVFGLLGLLAFGLIGFASGGVTGGRISSVGSVGDEPIPVNTYAQSLRSTVQTISNQIGRNLTAQEVQAFGLQSTAMQNVVSGAALSSEASRLGLSAGNDQVAEEIFATRAFTGVDGKFDKEAYEYTLERSGMSAKEYEAQTRKAIARGLIESAVAAGSNTPQSQAMALITFAREKRSFDYVVLDRSLLNEKATNPTDTQIDEQYKAQPAKYTAPLTRALTYATLSPEMLADQVEIPEGLLAEEFAAQKSRFNRPARRALDRIAFPDTAAAELALAQIRENVITFDALAEQRGLAIADIDMGEIEQGELETVIDEVLFGTKNLGLIGPFDTDLGPTLFRINASIDAQNTTFEEATPELTAEYVGEESRRLIVEMVTELDELLAQGLSLEELVKETPMTLHQINMDASTANGIAAYAEFRDVALSIQKDDFPEIKDLSDGGIFAARLDSITEPALRPLTDVREQVVIDWANATDQAALVAKAASIAAQLDTGADFATLALSPRVETDITRDAFIENIPPTLVADLFTGETGKTKTHTNDDTVVVARINAITPFDPNADDSKVLVSQVQTQLGNQVTGDLLRLFSTALETRDGVTLNQNAINQVNTQILGGTGG
jgi:peptidyl-prolyl cis-trans isomerase D